MGANQSSSITNFTSALSESMINVINTTATSVNTTTKTVQQIQVNMMGSMVGCNMSSTQTITMSSTIQALQSASSNSQLSAMINQAVAQAAESSQKAVNGFLSTAFNNQNQNVSNTQKLQSIINEGVTNNTFTDVTTLCTNLQQGVYNYYGGCKDSTISLSQGVIVTEFVKSVNNAVLKSLASSSQVTTSMQKAITKQLSENKGVASLVTAVMGAMLGGIVLIVLLVVLVPKLLGGGGGAAGGKGGSAGGLENVIKSNPELLAFRLRSRRIR